MVLAIFLTGSFAIKKYQRIHQENLIIYHVRNHTALGILKGRYEILLADSNLITDNRKIDFNITPHTIQSGVHNLEIVDIEKSEICVEDIYKEGPFLYAAGLKILLIDSSTEIIPKISNERLSFDYVIFSRNPKVELAELTKYFEFEHIIFDSSNAPWNIDKWKLDCEKMDITYYDVFKLGAWLAIK